MNKVALVLLLAILSVSAHNTQQKKVVHQCMHDEMDFSKIVPQDYLETFEETYGERNLQNSTPQPIRITLDFKELDNPANGAGLTPNIKQYLKNIMYAAQVYLNKLIKVYPRTKPIKMTWGETCYDIKVTQEIQTVGIDNSDIHIYVTYSNEPNTTYLANAIWCQLDPNPIVGRVKFNIGVMNIDESSTQAFQDNFSTSLHEILHILGFSGSSVSYWIDPDTGKPYGSENAYKIVKKERRWEKDNVIKVSSKNIVRVSRNHYACPSIDGMYLENQGGGGSMGSHWERDLLGNEFMTASIVYGVYTISEFTAALLLDTGYYAEINSNLLMPIYWGKNKGCDFFNNTCNTGKYFPEYPDSSVQESCDFFSQGIGNLANYDYFSQCNKIQTYSNSYCEDSDQFKPDARLRQNTGTGSRCFRSNANIKGDEIHDMKGRCFKSKCASDLSSIEVNVWENEYVTCKYPNQIINLADSTKTTQGTMKCPDDFDLFCNFPKSCSNNCSNNGVCNNGYCVCLIGWAGQDCSQRCSQDQAWDGTRCVNRCPAGQFKNLDNTCKSTCPYKQFGDNNTGSCQLCHVNCSACTGPTPNECLSCNNGYILSNSKCVDVLCHSSCQSCSGPSSNQCTTCPTGNYLDTNKTCQPCQSPCETCSTATQCTSCSQGFFMDKFSGKCVSNNTCDSSCLTCSAFRDPTKCTSCRDGQFVNKDGRCQKCDESCAKCTEREEKCLSCAKGYDQYDEQNQRCYMKCHDTCNTCTAPNDPSACKYCIAGYVLKNGLCVPCDKNCYTCEGESYLCTACERGYQLDTQYKTCKAICKSNEYQDRDGTCKTCTSPCATCQYYDNYCTSCVSGYTFNRNYCEPNNRTCDQSCATCRQYNDSRACDSCRDGMFLSNGQCLNCSSNCVTCSKNSQTCTSCRSGQFLQNGQCQTCDSSCLTCSGIAQNCTSCRDGFSIDTKTGLCTYIPLCKDGEFLDRTNQCKPCSSPCSTCLYYNNRCTSCISGYQLNKQQNICEIPIPTCRSNEFLDSNKQCKPCSSPCATCQSNSTTCTSCISGYTQKGTTCEATVKTCHQSCVTCSKFDDANACSSCRDGSYLTKQGSCLKCSDSCSKCSVEAEKCIECSKGYDFDTKTQRCTQKCHSSCNDCTAPNNASACKSCASGYFMKNNVCVACDSSCLTCDQASYFCTSCRNGDTFDKIYGTCTPNCKQDQFLDRDNQCKPCASPCGTCEFYDNRCTSCITGYEFQSEYLSCRIVCKSNEFVDYNTEKCKPCSAPCASCEYYDNRCLSCVPGYTYNNYYCDKNSQTSARGCHDSCASCSRSMDPRACESCRDGFILSNGICQKKKGNYTQPQP